MDFRAQVDLRALGEELAARGAARLERRRAVVAELRRVARESQAQLAPFLEGLQRRGEITYYRGFTVVNRLFIEGRPAAFRALAARPEVAAIIAETESHRPVWMGETPPPPEKTPRSWAVAATRADIAWKQGLDGAGVVVGAIDTGASATHEALRDNYLGPARGWCDPTGASAEPGDGVFAHGAGVLSCAVGRNVGGVVVGVAPGARWAACAALPDGRFNNVWMTECADWMLEVAQPDVLVNAWLLPTEGCDESMKPIVNAWRAAEIVPIFTAGNLGPTPGMNRSPANYTGLHPGGGVAFAVGGVTEAGELYPRSGTGPNSCDPKAVFPSVVAGAEHVLVAFPLSPSSYTRLDGTSFAAGLAGGAAAILLQSDPEASVSEVEAALREGAVDLGPPGPDDRFGYGRLDVPGALSALARLRGTKVSASKTTSTPAHE